MENKELVKSWLKQKKEYSQTEEKTLYYKGMSLYSNQTDLVLARMVINKENKKVVFINTDSSLSIDVDLMVEVYDLIIELRDLVDSNVFFLKSSDLLFNMQNVMNKDAYEKIIKIITRSIETIYLYEKTLRAKRMSLDVNPMTTMAIDKINKLIDLFGLRRRQQLDDGTTVNPAIYEISMRVFDSAKDRRIREFLNSGVLKDISLLPEFIQQINNCA